MTDKLARPKRTGPVSRANRSGGSFEKAIWDSKTVVQKVKRHFKIRKTGGYMHPIYQSFFVVGAGDKSRQLIALFFLL